ncbi:MAG: flagellar motor switch phosphatase FliY [Lachnospiraceae bacterium]|nr:flagellar motor switch phosphatase FliY [Lachnospiraceae bacterium]
MDGMLSQDEINALLNGMDLSGDEAPDLSEAKAEMEAKAAAEPPRDAFLTGTEAVEDDGISLTDVEKDAIGEVANISMGSSATTLYSLVNQKVNITTPVVELSVWDDVLNSYERPCVFIQIKYTKGLDGTNILVLKEKDVKVITDLMMGGDGTNTEGELGELHLSAISEAMNQMMGAAATSLSTMLQSMIDISPPVSSLLDLTKFENGAEISPFLGGKFVKITFRMQIGDDLVDSSIMQMYPIDFAKKLVDTFINSQTGGDSAPAAEPAPAAAPQQPAPDTSGQAGMQPQMGMQPGMGMPAGDPNQMMGMQGMPMQGMPMQGMPMQGMPMMGMPMQGYPMQPQMMGMPMQPQANVNIQPAQFQNFTPNLQGIQGGENIGLIMDVPLEVTVELGRTAKSISEILNFAPGTIIELERIAGEPIDVLVNGKFVAKGEVVVIEESFGVRVTEIIKD